MPDYYPTLYPDGPARRPDAAGQLIYEPGYRPRRPAARAGADGLPLRLPGCLLPAPDPEHQRPHYGWIHSPEPDVVDSPANPYQYRRATPTPLDYLQNLNHNPLDLGDNLPHPSSAT